MKEEILSHIREVCNLKRLEFGCEVRVLNQPMISDTLVKYISDYGVNPLGEVEIVGHRGLFNTKDIQIIGLPVELQDCLQVLPKEKWLGLCELWQGHESLDKQKDEVFDFIEAYSI